MFLYQKASCRWMPRDNVRYDPFKLRNVPHDQWSKKLLEARIPILIEELDFGRDLQRAVSNGKWIFAPHTRDHDRTKMLRGKFTVAERACTAYDGRGWKYRGIYYHTRCREDSMAWCVATFFVPRRRRVKNEVDDRSHATYALRWGTPRPIDRVVINQLLTSKLITDFFERPILQKVWTTSAAPTLLAAILNFHTNAL